MTVTSKELIHWLKIVFSTMLLGVFCALFANLLRTATETTEHLIFRFIEDGHGWHFLATPLLGLLLVFFVTEKIFHLPISGIREVVSSLREPVVVLKPVKMVIHFLSGFFTVIFGGSTGIEVSTVVASATAGSWSQRCWPDFKSQLIIAGAAAGIAGLFKSPLAGIFFAVEVLMFNFSWTAVALSALASFTSYAVSYYLNGDIMFHPMLNGWKWQAIPLYMLFSIPAALLSVTLTWMVISSKSIFMIRFGNFYRVLVGGAILGIILFAASSLYGDGYQVIERLLTLGKFEKVSTGYWMLLLLLFLKPLATSITLASGGDGGVFAPSLFLGAVAGYLFAQISNYFGANIIEVNFIIAGMAAVLGGCLHAPLTAAFLTMSITGSYELFVPVFMTSILTHFLTKRIYPFTVYSYGD